MNEGVRLVTVNLYLSINVKHLPELRDIISIMYFAGASYSWVGDDDDLRFGEGVEFCWDKWVNDQRWSGREDGKTYISVELNRNLILHVYSEEEIPLVDQRAIVVFVKHLLEADDKNSWSSDQTRWRSKAEFLFKYKEILSHTFESALERSFR
jgi:hypothetical protein